MQRNKWVKVSNFHPKALSVPTFGQSCHISINDHFKLPTSVFSITKTRWARFQLLTNLLEQLPLQNHVNYDRDCPIVTVYQAYIQQPYTLSIMYGSARNNPWRCGKMLWVPSCHTALSQNILPTLKSKAITTLPPTKLPCPFELEFQDWWLLHWHGQDNCNPLWL